MIPFRAAPLTWQTRNLFLPDGVSLGIILQDHQTGYLCRMFGRFCKRSVTKHGQSGAQPST